jgi:hypothetical protein
VMDDADGNRHLLELSAFADDPAIEAGWFAMPRR